MAIKTYKPTTPSRRHMTVSAFEGIDKKAKPERSLTENLKKKRRPQQLRPHHRPPPRRRQQEEVPHHRLQASVRDRKVCRSIPHGRHGSHRRSGCRRRSPVAGTLCRHHHYHYPQDSPRSERRSDPDQRRGTGKEDQQGSIPPAHRAAR